MLQLVLCTYLSCIITLVMIGYALTSYSHGRPLQKDIITNYVYNNFYVDRVGRYFDLKKKENPS